MTFEDGDPPYDCPCCYRSMTRLDNLLAGSYLVFLYSLLPLMLYLLCLISEARFVLLLDGNHAAVDSLQPL